MFWKLILDIYNNKYYAISSIIFTVIAIPGLVGWILYIFYGFWIEREILSFFKNKKLSLMQNKGFITQDPQGKDYVQVYNNFMRSLSKRNIKAIVRLIQKGKLTDNPYKNWGAGRFSHLYLTNFL
jgi:hypothetical protein